MNGVCRHLKLAFVFGDNPMLAHQTGYPVSTTGMTAFIQLGMDSRTAIGRATPLMNSFDLHQQPAVLLATGQVIPAFSFIFCFHLQ